MRSNWLLDYVAHAKVGSEIPEIFHTFAGISAIASAMKKKIYIDQYRFKWYPSLYILFVAKAGKLNKSTAIASAKDILKGVPGIKFGPDVATTEALTTAWADALESYTIGTDTTIHKMSAITLISSELGSLLDMQNAAMINLLIELWDSKASHTKATKTCGSDHIEEPWINLIGGTTPAWLRENMTANAMEGGLTARMLFVYSDKAKERLVAYPSMVIDQAENEKRVAALVEGLTHISKLAGPMVLDAEAMEWGTEWYEQLHKSFDDDDPAFLSVFKGRKQTHLHKLAMVLSVAESDDLVLRKHHLEIANTLLLHVESGLKELLSGVGTTDEGKLVADILQVVKIRQPITYPELFNIFCHRTIRLEEIVSKLIQGRKLQAKKTDPPGSLLISLAS